ncbi:MAG: hypothetical protein U0457_16600 [Candidatus Sericytochromatia bacterium]
MKKSKKLSLILIITSLLGCNNLILENSKKIEEPKKEAVIAKTQEPIVVKSVIPTPTAILSPVKEPEKTNGILKTQENTGSAENNKTPLPTSTPSNVGNGVNNLSSFYPQPIQTNTEPPFIVIKNPVIAPIPGVLNKEFNVNSIFSSFYHNKKIKFNKNTNVFYSLDPSVDLTKLNNLISYYKKNANLRINSLLGNSTEEEIDKSQETLKNAIPNYKVSYLYDMFYFILDSNVIEFSVKLREFDFFEKIRVDEQYGVLP